MSLQYMGNCLFSLAVHGDSVDIADVTDLTKDRTVWWNLVQTHRQFTRWKRKKKTCRWLLKFPSVHSHTQRTALCNHVHCNAQSLCFYVLLGTIITLIIYVCMYVCMCHWSNLASYNKLYSVHDYVTDRCLYQQTFELHRHLQFLDSVSGHNSILLSDCNLQYDQLTWNRALV